MNSVSGSYKGVKVLPKKANPCFSSVSFSAFLFCTFESTFRHISLIILHRFNWQFYLGAYLIYGNCCKDVHTTSSHGHQGDQ